MYTVLWLILMVLFTIAEIGTVSLISVWFALGAFAAMLAALLKLGVLVQIVLFTVVSALSLALIYPRIRKKTAANRTPTNADRIVGMTAVVTEAIDAIAGTGAVKVDGKVWSARTADGGTLVPGALVKVRKIEGVRAIVEAVKAE